MYLIIDIDESTDEQRLTNDNHADWSIEMILYPNWLYNDKIVTTKENLHTSTFNHLNSCQTLETNGSFVIRTNNGKRTRSSNSQSSPKQVRFGCREEQRSYPHLSTTIQQLRTRIATTKSTANVSNNNFHDTFI